MAELQIKNLHVTAADKQILKGVDLHVRPGEFHALMGPNGSGKSTLAELIEFDSRPATPTATTLTTS
jgi:Fe-S cluster assembly ATP-binding protein